MDFFTGKLIKDKFFQHPLTGQFWDLCPVKREAGENEVGLNERINSINGDLKRLELAPSRQVWQACLFLLDSQIAKISPQWQAVFQPKTYLMIFRSGCKKPTRAILAGAWETDFLWSSVNKVYTRWTPDNLNYRFRVVSEDEVNAFSSNQPDSTDDESSQSSDYPISQSEFYIHLKCPHCGKDVF